MIFKIKQTSLRNKEFIQYHTDTCDIIQKKKPTNPKLEKIFLKYKNEVENIVEVFINPRGKQITKTLQSLDGNRDATVVGIGTYVTSLTYHFNSEIRQCAFEIKTFLESYGSSIARLNYSEETSAITDIVTKIKTKENLINAVSKLQLNDWFAQLEKENEEFHKVHLTRIAEKGVDKTIERLVVLRDRVDTQYDELINFVEALIIIEGEENCITMVNELNVLIEEYNQRLVYRTGAGLREEEDVLEEEISE